MVICAGGVLLANQGAAKPRGFLTPQLLARVAWRKRRLVAGTPMNDSIFHAQTLQTEVFRSARRLVEIEKYFVHRIPTGDDLVDLLIA